ncbi:hypothetical protein ACFYXF_39060 [Streptomyces sp. NPDC002680]|uniref:hypothetical protein n=1 Tax=Streptomyces sp. NPDC002680 TaxID=3364659 RepID=UPI0036AEE6E9
MSSTPDTLPRISRPDVDSVLVGVLNAGGGEGQEAVADAVVSHWRSVEWPQGLVSVNCFTSTQNGQVLTYEQWASEETLQKSLLNESGFRAAPGAAAGSGGLVPYRLYQVVRGTAVSDPPPPARSFPVAAFPMEGHEAARRWIADLLASEEAAAGADRAYPGAIAANIHIALDGGSVLIFSEWLSAEEAITHMQIVTKAMLMDVGNSEDDLGSLYVHHATLTR